MTPRIATVLLLFAPLLLAGGPEPVAARKGVIRKTVERKGTFLPADFSELKLRLEVYRGEMNRGEFRITEVAPHGQFVNEGDVVVRLDATDVESQARREALALERAAMDLRHAEARARLRAEDGALALERAERDAHRANERLRGFQEHEKAHREEDERLDKLRAEHRLDDQKDELDQLEKMYAEDELVDATEEIVLKRQRRNFAYTAARQELSEAQRLYRKEFYEPWQEEDLLRGVKENEIALAHARESEALARERSDLDVAQKRLDLEQQKQRVEDLERDRAQFVVRAPRAGLFLHGAADAAPWAGRLEPDTKLRSHSVFATVAEPRKLKVKTEIVEKDLLRLKDGLAAEVAPEAAEDRKLIGRLHVAVLPSKAGIFEAEVALGETPVGLRPGMTCTVRIIEAEERDAVLVPAGAVVEKDGVSIVKAAATAEGPFAERRVVVGIGDGTDVSIREGVAEGEFVLVEGK